MHLKTLPLFMVLFAFHTTCAIRIKTTDTIACTAKAFGAFFCILKPDSQHSQFTVRNLKSGLEKSLNVGPNACAFDIYKDCVVVAYEKAESVALFDLNTDTRVKIIPLKAVNIFVINNTLYTLKGNELHSAHLKTNAMNSIHLQCIVDTLILEPQGAIVLGQDAKEITFFDLESWGSNEKLPLPDRGDELYTSETILYCACFASHKIVCIDRVTKKIIRVITLAFSPEHEPTIRSFYPSKSVPGFYYCGKTLIPDFPTWTVFKDQATQKCLQDYDHLMPGIFHGNDPITLVFPDQDKKHLQHLLTLNALDLNDHFARLQPEQQVCLHAALKWSIKENGLDHKTSLPYSILHITKDELVRTLFAHIWMGHESQARTMISQFLYIYPNFIEKILNKDH